MKSVWFEHKCVICGEAFVRKKKSRRVTCSRSCSVALSWRCEGCAERRKKSIREQALTPKALARTARLNAERWSDPEEHKKLVLMNRDRWSDPETKAKLSEAIKRVQNQPEMRDLYAEIRKDAWKDPEIRARYIDGIRASKERPEYIRRMRDIMKENWKDPKMRAKYLRKSSG